MKHFISIFVVEEARPRDSLRSRPRLSVAEQRRSLDEAAVAA
jgi:hypothetical protein